MGSDGMPERAGDNLLPVMDGKIIWFTDPERYYGVRPADLHPDSNGFIVRKIHSFQLPVPNQGYDDPQAIADRKESLRNIGVIRLMLDVVPGQR